VLETMELVEGTGVWLCAGGWGRWLGGDLGKKRACQGLNGREVLFRMEHLIIGRNWRE
jgi:hypothetical protein